MRSVGSKSCMGDEISNYPASWTAFGRCAFYVKLSTMLSKPAGAELGLWSWRQFSLPAGGRGTLYPGVLLAKLQYAPKPLKARF